MIYAIMFSNIVGFSIGKSFRLQTDRQTNPTTRVTDPGGYDPDPNLEEKTGYEFECHCFINTL